MQLTGLLFVLILSASYTRSEQLPRTLYSATGVAPPQSPSNPARKTTFGATFTRMVSLPRLDAHGFNGIREITRAELVELMAKFRPLSLEENANLNRGCPGFVCVYQGLGLKRWPELAPGTVAYLSRRDALNRRCPNDQENFVFLKQGCWSAGKPPVPNTKTGEVPVDSITRSKPGLYTFNYAVYFPSTATYAWLNHRDYGFPFNRIRPQKAYLSPFPPPLNDDTRPAQIYCSTCR
jgi:hypothetical protein